MANDKSSSSKRQQGVDITPNEALDMLRSACEYMRLAGLTVNASESDGNVTVCILETYITTTKTGKPTFAQGQKQTIR